MITVLLFILALGSAFAMRAKFYARRTADNLAIQGTVEKPELEPIYYGHYLHDARRGARSDPVVLEGPHKNVSWFPGGEDGKIRLLRFDNPLPYDRSRDLGIVKMFGPPDAFRVMLVGNSIAAMYALDFEGIARDKKINICFAIYEGMPLFEAKRHLFTKSDNEAVCEEVSRWNPDALVLSMLWDSYPTAFLKKELYDFIAKIQPYSKKIILVAQPPTCKYGNKEDLRVRINLMAIKEKTKMPRMERNENNGRFLRNLAVLEEVSQVVPNCYLVRVDRLFTKADGSILYAQEGKLFYRDPEHLSRDGAERVRPLFEEVLEKAMKLKKEQNH
ncbi:MAG: hypothetical protein LBD01_03680 [Puniceicoccales bacterium]|nr:hypothetical protein [Puniceicoccales bacterium]